MEATDRSQQINVKHSPLVGETNWMEMHECWHRDLLYLQNLPTRWGN